MLILNDLSAAYDTVNQCILMSIISDIKLRENVFFSFKKYLQHRGLRTCIGEQKSSLAETKTKVLSGTEVRSPRV